MVIYLYPLFKFYIIFKKVIRTINKLDDPVVDTAAVPTTDERAITKLVETTFIARPCIHVVAVDDPEIVSLSIAKVPEVGPVYRANEPAEDKLIS